MNISKKIPVIVSLAVLVIWVFVGIWSVMRGSNPDPEFYQLVKLAEDVRVARAGREDYDTLSGEQNDYTVISAGSSGVALITYSHRSSYINDPNTDVFRFHAGLGPDGSHSNIFVKTGPESQLAPNEIYYKKIENYREIISEYNRKVKEEKHKRILNVSFKILISIIMAAVFSGIFWLECFIANKINMHPVGFGIICTLYIGTLLFGLLFTSLFLLYL